MDKPLDISQYALVADHGLGGTHSGVIVDVQTRMSLIPVGPVRLLCHIPLLILEYLCYQHIFEVTQCQQ